MFEKYTKPCHNSLFSSAIKNDTEKIFVTMVGLIKTKFDIINGKLYQTFFCKGAPSQYKNLIKPLWSRAGYIVQWFNYK